MNWKQRQPCSHCGKPTDVEHHKFSSGGKEWSYFAPLYHNVAERLGFCGPECVMGWITTHNVNGDKNGN